MTKLQLAVLSAALAGCANVPVSAGGKDEIQFAGLDLIRIAWNPQLTTERNERAKAVAYCGGRDVDEVEASMAGAVQVKTWRCQPFPGTGM